jgi:type IV pilus assembly protein PilY1
LQQEQIAMSTFTKSKSAALALVVALCLGLPATAEIADISPVPLANSPSDAVKPNLMYILDDSGSMAYRYMPDQVHRSSRSEVYQNCKKCATPNTVETVSNSSSTERITTVNSHGGVVGSPVIFTYGTVPSPLVIGTTYYIAYVDATDQFRLSANPSTLVSAVNTGTEVITTQEAHGLVANQPVIFTGTPPGGLSAGTIYFVRSALLTATNFTVSTAAGGTAININAATTGAQVAGVIDLTSTSTGASVVVGQAVRTVTTGTEQIATQAAHNGIVGSTVIFTAGVPPSAGTPSVPLLLNTPYFIASRPSTTTFTLSATLGGSTLDLTGSRVGAAFIVDGGCAGAGPRFNANNTPPSPGQACGNDSTDADASDDGDNPTYGEAPFYASAFNQIYYNPDINYSPAVNYDGTSIGNATITAARRDYWLDAGTDNMVAGYTEVYYCAKDNPSAAELIDTAVCRKNGVHNVAPFLGAGQPDYFLYWNSGTGRNLAFPTLQFPYKVRVTTSNAHYYTITPNEYCSDNQFTTCALATPAGAAPAGFGNAVTVRWCKTPTDASSPLAVSGNSGAPATPRCRKNFDRTTHPYPRYGRFKRTDIISSGTFTKGPNAIRPDCAGASCSYAEEIQNFANWYTFYRNRLALMKTATGRAFLSIDNRYRIGFITINPNDPVTASKFLAVDAFEPGAGLQKQNWYTKLYAQNTNGSTPLREALSRVGRYYAGRVGASASGTINEGMGTADPMQYSCQQNFALLTTDGYWNGSGGQNLSGSGVGTPDSSNSGFMTRASGSYDGGLASETLADVAAYYYVTDLRTTGPLAENNVPTTVRDGQSQQHMVTFTLGLGLKGLMEYVQNYETASTGDFRNIKDGASGACSWVAGTCNWPAPSENEPSTLDDLWHAAVNSRGLYFSAGDPNSLAIGLQSALAALNVQTASASAAATSSPNITQTDNFIYSSSFRTAKWDGEIVAQRIDPVTGLLIPTIEWSAQGQLDSRAMGNSDTRVIYTIDDVSASKRKAFDWASLTAVAVGGITAERSYFGSKCGSLSQCTLLTVSQQASANDGNNLVNYLRGQRQYETFTAPETLPVFREREHILGDSVNATPAFLGAPRFNFADAVTPTYESFKTANTARQKTLFIAANDGMLHAFNGDTGTEMWAYVPRIIMPKLHRLATANWGSTHEFLVDGSPRTLDIYAAGAWKTILVAGLNSGGRGYYALDVTNPSNPTVLWEFCNTSTVCTNYDGDLGLTYGNPVIMKRPSDGKWVVAVTSGVNNVGPGTGQGYLYVLDALSGALLSKTATGAGDLTTPSGLSKIAGFADAFNTDATVKFIYGGDLLGNVWKFDMQTVPPTVLNLAQLKDGGGKPQSITTRPELAEIEGFPVVYVGTGRYLGADDLVDGATLSPPLAWAYGNALYAIKDKGVAYGNFRTGNVVQNTIIDNTTTRTTTNLTVDWSVKDGWLLDFNPGNTSPGERVNIDPQLVAGTLLVATNVPNNSACSVGGDSWFYTFDYKTGAQSPAATVAGTKLIGRITVGFVVVRLPNGAIRAFIKSSKNDLFPVSVPMGGNVNKVRRTSFRELVQIPK